MRRALALVALLAADAHADPLDELGFGAAATGMGNAAGATTVGAAAAHVNPAGVALGERPELLLGYQYAHDRLSIDGLDAGHADAHGTSIGIAIPLPIGAYRAGAGVALYLPDQQLARIQLHPVTEPHYARLESAAQRLVVEPVASLARGRWAIGAGASILADARTRDLTFDVGVLGGSKRGDARVDLALPLRVAPVASVRFAATPALTLAASVRGELSLDLAFDIRANVNVPNVVTGDATVRLRSVSYFSPMRGALSAAYRVRPDLVVTADLAWERYSALGSGVPDLRVLLALDIEPPVISSMQPPARFRDIVTPRAGVEWQPGTVRWRAGAGYLPSPVPPQTGVTSFADGARTLAAVGAGIVIEPNGVLTRALDLDVALAWTHVFHALVVKDPMLQPGGAFSSGGDLLQASASATVRF